MHKVQICKLRYDQKPDASVHEDVCVQRLAPLHMVDVPVPRKTRVLESI